MRRKKVASKTERVLVIPDVHVPSEDKLSMRALERYMADHKWDEIIYLGDFMDLNVISSHNANNLRAVMGQSLAKDYAAGNAILDRHQALCPGAKFVYLEGNHEFRTERYINARPEMEGLCEVPIRLNLEQRGILWVPSWSEGAVYSKGKANYSHGLYCCKNHARKHVEAFGGNLFYGHTHDVELCSKVFYGENTTVVAQSLGCMCTYGQSYLKGRPTNWQQAFATFNFRPDGYFNYFVTMLFNNAFVSPEGVFYDGKKK
jgi:predicted phosphodiesterase